MVCAEINYVYHYSIKAFTVANFKRKVKTKGSELNQIRKERKNKNKKKISKKKKVRGAAAARPGGVLTSKSTYIANKEKMM